MEINVNVCVVRSIFRYAIEIGKNYGMMVVIR